MTRARLAVLAALLAGAAGLAGCGNRPGPDSYRDPGRPISSMAVLEVARLQGNWHEVAGFGPACTDGTSLRIPAGAGSMAGTACFLPLPKEVRLEAAGPGRFKAAGTELWLLWVDFDYRTMVIGTPSGQFGAILNRDGPIPSDRLEAARRILEFNGYDLGRLTLR